MEILSSGSFINLENKKKIEQLVFTAREIAETAAETEGFEINEETNKRFALEIWEGAEYMCRDIEEVQIKNIFISNFLERLKELSRVSKTPHIPVELSETKPHVNQTDSDSNDEYLGLVQTDQKQENSDSEFGLNEPAEKPETIKIETSETLPVIETDVKETERTDESSFVETVGTEVAQTQYKSETRQKDSAENVSDESIQAEKTQTEDTKPQTVSSIVLPEKEPYQFDKCTVTATIQILPTDVGTRKIVLSVRTHDFAPQISVHEVTGKVSPPQLIPLVEKAFEKYKGDLPVKVMDKLRKEKNGGKKKKRKSSANVTETSEPNPVKNVSEAEAGSSEKEQPAMIAPQTETNPQGNLFRS